MATGKEGHDLDDEEDAEEPSRNTLISDHKEDNKGREDIDFINPPEDIECPICLQVLTDPHMVSCCGEKMCESCITRVQYANQPCPVCREVGFTTMLEKRLQRMILGLQVRCTYNKHGCQWRGELRELYKHIDVESGKCEFVEVTCPYGCNGSFPRCQMDQHEPTCICLPRELKHTYRLMDSLRKEFECVLTETKNEAKKEINELRQKHEQQLEEVKQEHKKEMEEMRVQIEKKNDTVKFNPLIDIDGVTYSVLQLPSSTAPIVMKTKAIMSINSLHSDFVKCVEVLGKYIHIAYCGSSSKGQKDIQIIAKNLALLEMDKLANTLQRLLHSLPFSFTLPIQVTHVSVSTKEIKDILEGLGKKCKDMAAACKNYIGALDSTRNNDIVKVGKLIVAGLEFLTFFWQRISYSFDDSISIVASFDIVFKKIQVMSEEKQTLALLSDDFKTQLIDYYASMVATASVCLLGTEKFKTLQLSLATYINRPLSADEAKQIAQKI